MECNLLRLYKKNEFLEKDLGTSLVVQWLRLQASNAGSTDSIPYWELRSHMP